MKYTVKTGDTMYSIAKRFGVPFHELVKANPEIPDPDLIYPGQVLEISSGGQTKPEIPPGLKAGYPPEILPGNLPYPPNLYPGMPSVFPGGPGFAPGIPGFYPGGPCFPPGIPGYPSGAAGYLPGGMPPFIPRVPGSGGPMVPDYPCGQYSGVFAEPGFPGGVRQGFPGAEKSFVLKRGDRGNYIEHLQTKLKEMGYYKGPLTGHFSKRTKYAVMKLQKDCKLPVDGVVSSQMWSSML